MGIGGGASASTPWKMEYSVLNYGARVMFRTSSMSLVYHRHISISLANAKVICSGALSFIAPSKPG